MGSCKIFNLCTSKIFRHQPGVMGAVLFGILIAQDPDEQVQEKLLGTHVTR